MMKHIALSQKQKEYLHKLHDMASLYILTTGESEVLVSSHNRTDVSVFPDSRYHLQGILVTVQHIISKGYYSEAQGTYINSLRPLYAHIIALKIDLWPLEF